MSKIRFVRSDTDDQRDQTPSFERKPVPLKTFHKVNKAKFVSEHEPELEE